MDLLTGLTAISQTLAITKDLREIDDKIVVAEFKLKIAEMVDKLLDARQALQDAQEREFALKGTISDLQRKMSESADFEDEDGLLYRVDSLRKRIGEPFCNFCSVKEGKKYRLVFGQYHLGSYFCTNCKNVYGARSRTRSGSLETGWNTLNPYEDDKY